MLFKWDADSVNKINEIRIELIEMKISSFICRDLHGWKSMLSSDERKAIIEVALGEGDNVLPSVRQLSDLGKQFCIRVSAAHGQLTIIKSLIEQCDPCSGKLLVLAAEKGYYEVVRFILGKTEYFIDPLDAHKALCHASARGGS
ncbi:MAG: hypothetical protein H0T84_04530 [Tatlockia sp.]|nr:hypothetical protein [Tatlockia sp.]